MAMPRPRHTRETRADNSFVNRAVFSADLNADHNANNHVRRVCPTG